MVIVMNIVTGKGRVGLKLLKLFLLAGSGKSAGIISIKDDHLFKR
jgi:hypothetical protein